MSTLTVFNFLSLNGYYKGANEDISWHQHGEHGDDEQEFSKENTRSDGILIFGRVTYEMMASFWPTPDAAKAYPEVARNMNASEKIVFSKTLKKADWNNTRVIKGNIVEEIKILKKGPKNMAILGSGSITNQLAAAGLIDEYQFMIDPVALGSGTPVLKDINNNIELTLTKTRVFKSGRVLLCYEQAK